MNQGLFDTREANHIIQTYHISSQGLFIYRVLASGLYTIPTAFYLYSFRNVLGLMMVFFTNWGFWAGLITFVLLAVCHYRALNNKGSLNETRACEIIFQVAFSMHSIITILFWAVLWDSFIHELNPTRGEIIFAVFAHGGVWLLLWIDILFNDFRFQSRDAYYLLAVLLCYMVVNIYYSLTENPVYPIITWKDLMSFVWAVVVLIVTFGSFFFGQWLHRFKSKKRQTPAGISQF